MTSTLTSKCQITIPKFVREELGLKPGDAVEFSVSSSGVVLRRKVDRDRMRCAIGCWADQMKGVSVKQLLDDLRGPVELPSKRKRK